MQIRTPFVITLLAAAGTVAAIHAQIATNPFNRAAFAIHSAGRRVR